MADSLLDTEFLARLEYLYIVTRELFVGHMSAERISKKFGFGLEFADHRSYTIGDDFRYIDWSVYARRGDLLIKLFSEEQSVNLYFVIDASRSMGVGKPQKLLYAKKVAAALAYIGMANLDPVTIVAFDERLRAASRSFNGRGQLQPMLRFVDSIGADGQGTSLGDSFRGFVRQFPSHGMVVVLSDFLDGPGYEEAIRLLHYHRHSLLAIQVNDKDELEPPFSGDMELVDSEAGTHTTVQITPELVADYRRRVTEHYAELSRLCKVLRRGHVPVTTDVPFEDLIFQVFRKGGFLR